MDGKYARVPPFYTHSCWLIRWKNQGEYHASNTVSPPRPKWAYPTYIKHIHVQHNYIREPPHPKKSRILLNSDDICFHLSWGYHLPSDIVNKTLTMFLEFTPSRSSLLSLSLCSTQKPRIQTSSVSNVVILYNPHKPNRQHKPLFLGLWILMR